MVDVSVVLYYLYCCKSAPGSYSLLCYCGIITRIHCMMALAQPLYYCDLLLFKSVFLYCFSWHQCSKKVFLHITVNLIRCGSASKFVLAGMRQLVNQMSLKFYNPLMCQKLWAVMELVLNS